MNPTDFELMFALVCLAIVAICLFTGWLESRPEPLEWDRDSGAFCDCGARGMRDYHRHPARPWITDRKR